MILRKIHFSALAAGILFLVCCAGSAYGQDYIVRTNNDTIRAHIVDIGVDRIKFQRYGMKNGPILEIYKNQVKEIIFEDGSHLTIIYDIYSIAPDRLIHERTHLIKVDFMSPLLNHLTLGYEFRLKQGKNLEFKAGYIGRDISTALKHSDGALFKAGIKFIWLTESIYKGQKYLNPLRGSYIKPELLFSKYTTREEGYNVNYTNFGINIVFGRQYTFGQLITLDYFAGIGYGYQYSSYNQVSNYDKKNVDYSYAYSHLFFGKKLPLLVSGGMTAGITF